MIDELKRLGYDVLREVSRTVARTDERFVGKSVDEIDHDLFQVAICEMQVSWFKNLGQQRIYKGDFCWFDVIACYYEWGS